MTRWNSIFPTQSSDAGREKQKERECCLASSARPFLLCSGNSEGVFCQNTPDSKSPEVQVTSISLHLILSPFTSQNPCSALTFRFLQNTHFCLEVLCLSIAMHCSSLGTGTCMVQNLPMCVQWISCIFCYSSTFCNFENINSWNLTPTIITITKPESDKPMDTSCYS